MKIAIVGYSGSGKSTLARDLASHYGIEALHLDKIHWLPGWIERPREDTERIIGEYLDSHPCWVIDGNYSGIHNQRRMEEADEIVFLCFNRISCLLRCVKRYLQNRGKSRFSMTEGCPEKIDWEFILWILRDGRSKRHKTRYKNILQQYGEKTVVIRNQKQLTAYRREKTAL